MSKSSRPLSTDPQRREAERSELLEVLADAHRLMDAAGYPQPHVTKIGAPTP